MLKFIEILKNIWAIDELKNRILITLFFLAIYRLGAQVVLPGVDYNIIADAKIAGGGGLLGLLNAFTGGAFANASVFALGIMPYISASIVVQLMGVAVPYLQKLQKEGESGRKTITQITRWLTIAICVVQAPAYLYGLGALGVPDSAFVLGKGVFFIVPSVIILVTGCIFAMWLGEKITDRGIGNGISLLITVGIIASLPLSFTQEIVSQLSSSGGWIMIAIEVLIWFIVVALCILLVLAVRQIPVQYARRSVSGSSSLYSKRQYIPLRLNASGVMPIIFAQAIMFVPITLVGFSENESLQGLAAILTDFAGLWYNVLFFFMIVAFTYFYTAMTVNPNQMADDMKKNGGFVPGIKPGRATADYLDNVMSRITFPGSLFLGIVAILPAFAMQGGVNIQFAQFYGGTSLLILVGVILDTLQQIESHLLMRHYDGLMESGRIKGKSSGRIM